MVHHRVLHLKNDSPKGVSSCWHGRKWIIRENKWEFTVGDLNIRLEKRDFRFKSLLFLLLCICFFTNIYVKVDVQLLSVLPWVLNWFVVHLERRANQCMLLCNKRNTNKQHVPILWALLTFEYSLWKAYSNESRISKNDRNTFNLGAWSLTQGLNSLFKDYFQMQTLFAYQVNSRRSIAKHDFEINSISRFDQPVPWGKWCLRNLLNNNSWSLSWTKYQNIFSGEWWSHLRKCYSSVLVINLAVQSSRKSNLF